jgi:hypothetical protein
MERESVGKRFYGDKLKRAAHLLLFKRGKMPGAKDWELKTKLGRNYEEIVNQLSVLLSDLDLEVRKIAEEPVSIPTGSTLTSRGEAEARFLVGLKGSLTLSEARMCGWRIDNLSALSIAISYLISKQGKAPRKDVEKLLAYKFGRWRAMTLVDVFIRSGYLNEDETGLLSFGWRTRAEVDLKSLMTLLLEARPS